MAGKNVKWTDEEKELVSDYAKRLRAIGFKRGAFFLLKVIREHELKKDSPTALHDKVWKYCVKNASNYKPLVQEIADKTGYTFSVTRKELTRNKVNLSNPVAIEEFIEKRRRRRALNEDVSLNELGQVLLPNGSLKYNEGIIWQPDALPHEPETRLKQYEFLAADEDIVISEGGKGSGKSDLLIMDCVRPEKLGDPRWLGVIFRREYKRLDEIISRAHYWFGQMPWLRARWQGHKSRFVFPSQAALAFHNVQNLGDEEQYQGWEICDLKFDQLEEFAESQVNYLILQNRTGSKVRKTVRATANPGGAGHVWVKRRFISGKEPHMTHEIKVVIDGTEYVKTYRRIHTTVFDNPLLKNDKKYIATLAMEPDPVKRKAMFKGDWDIIIGQFFTSMSRDIHSLRSRDLPGHWKRAAGLDYGNTKVLEFLATDHFGNVYVEWEFSSAATEFNPDPMTASQFAEQSADFMLERGIGENLIVIGDVNLWSNTGRDLGSTRTPALIIQGVWKQKFEAKQKRPPVLFPVSKTGTEEYRYRIACNETTKDYLAYELNEEGEVKREPKLYFLGDRCPMLMETMPLLRRLENDMMDYEKIEDHWFDAFKMPFMQVMVTRKPEQARTAQEKWEDQHRLAQAQESSYHSPDYRVDCI